MRAPIVALCLLMACIAFAPVVHAHSDPWHGLAVSYNPAAPDRLALKTNRGVLLSDDHGATWHMLCRTLLGSPITTVVGVTHSASVLWGLWEGLFETTAQGCGLHEADTPMSGLWVKDVQRDPTQVGVWVAVTGRGGEPNGVFRSDDDGQSWRTLGDTTNVFLNAIRFSTDGHRMYVGTSEYIEATDAVVYAVRHSDDDGQSWTEHIIDVEPDDHIVDLLAVDPVDPNRIFAGVHVCREGQHRCFDPAVGQKHDRVLVSEDAGATWSVLMEVRELGGFAINEHYIWIGDWMGGLWRLTRDGASSRMIEGIYKPGCLAVHGEELLACGGALSDRFLLASSTDNGETFQPLGIVHEVRGAPVCESDDRDGGLSYAAVCAREWRDLCFDDGEFDEDPTPPPECGGQVMRDAGLPAAKSGEGCNCTTAGRGRSNPVRNLTFGGMTLVLIAARIRRRRTTTR